MASGSFSGPKRPRGSKARSRRTRRNRARCEEGRREVEDRDFAERGHERVGGIRWLGIQEDGVGNTFGVGDGQGPERSDGVGSVLTRG